MFNYFQVFHNLKNTTNSEVFKKIALGSIVSFNFKADPNYGHLSGFHKKYTMLCTVKLEWNNGHHKYNFLPIKKAGEYDLWKYDKDSEISVVVPIADDKNGDVCACEIRDHRYIILEVRSKLFKDYYHQTNNSEVEICFELTDEENLTSEDCKRIRHYYGDSKL